MTLYELEFGASGELASPLQLDRLITAGKKTSATDLLFLAHGFRCNSADATELYTNLLTNLCPHLAALTQRTFVVAGVYWPSQEFRETYGKSLSQDEFVASVLAQFGDGNDDPAEGLPLLHQFTGSELLTKLQTPVWPAMLPSEPRPEGGVLSVPLTDPIHNAVDTFLNFMSWTAMKKLSAEVGAKGLSASVLACQGELPAIRIHLAGHSLGGRLVTACCKELGRRQAKQIDSLSLLEAAFSHFGFSPDAGWGQAGFFRNVIETQIVRGPIISTFSKQDSVVGTAYAVASRLALDRLHAIGDSADPYGGIGHNGAQRTPESSSAALHRAGLPYEFLPGIVTCLDGSAVPGSAGPGSAGPGSAGPGSAGLIRNHGDVTNPHVAWAIASAISGA